MAERLPNLSDLRSPQSEVQTEFGDSGGQISTRQRRLWTLFQQTATSLTHIYKCKSKCQISNPEEQEAWLAFQSAASALTSLYRESADILSALEKTNSNPNSVSSNKEDTNDTNFVTSTQPPNVTKLKRSWSGWPDDDTDSFGGGGGKRRKFL